MERAPSGEEKRNQHNEFMRIYRLFKSNESDKMKVGSDGEKRYNVVTIKCYIAKVSEFIVKNLLIYTCLKKIIIFRKFFLSQ